VSGFRGLFWSWESKVFEKLTIRLMPQICWKNCAAIPRSVRRRFCEGPLVKSSRILKPPPALCAASASLMLENSTFTSSE
jgi:hypothetical protein